MKKQLFKNTSIKLATTYLAVLMLVSFIFSVSLYRVLVIELNRNYVRASQSADRFMGFRPDPVQRNLFLVDRAQDREAGKSHILQQLLFLNLGIIAVGGVFCYVLARRTLEPIEEAHMALERFTSDASHELRTPLATMRTEIEVALMNKKMDLAGAKLLLNSNLEEVDRLTHLSERLLMLARLDENGLPMDKVAAQQILQDAVSALASVATAKNITLSIKAPKDDLFVMADKASLTELVIILLDNAVKYSDAKTNVVIKAAQQGKYVHLSVADQGVGIAGDDLPNIFKRFYRADTSRTGGSSHGDGLGLALAQKIANLHDTTIEVNSKPGKGSTFSLSLPLT